MKTILAAIGCLALLKILFQLAPGIAVLTILLLAVYGFIKLIK